MIPGGNTHQRAYVRVSFAAVDEKDKIKRSPADISGVMSEADGKKKDHFFHEYFGYTVDQLRTDDQSPFNRYLTKYRRWQQNVQFRLNDYVSRFADAECSVAPASEEDIATEELMSEADDWENIKLSMWSPTPAVQQHFSAAADPMDRNVDQARSAEAVALDMRLRRFSASTSG